MEDPRWLRLITIGLVLSALAVGYFLLTGRFTQTKTTRPAQTVQPSQQTRAIQASPSPAALGLSNNSPKPSSLPSAAGSSKGGQPVASLPNTGFPLALIGIFSVSAIISGLGLRKYPN